MLYANTSTSSRKDVTASTGPIHSFSFDSRVTSVTVAEQFAQPVEISLDREHLGVPTRLLGVGSPAHELRAQLCESGADRRGGTCGKFPNTPTV